MSALCSSCASSITRLLLGVARCHDRFRHLTGCLPLPQRRPIILAAAAGSHDVAAPMLVVKASSSSSTTADEEEEEERAMILRKGIAEFYDESSGLWENIWGEHMHHGFYDPGSVASLPDHRAAQIRMIEQSLRFASVPGRSLPIYIFSFIHSNKFLFLYILILEIYYTCTSLVVVSMSLPPFPSLVCSLQVN